MTGYSDSAVYAAATILLLSIVAKLVAANMISKIRQDYNRLDQARKEILGRLKQAELANTSARGTQEFWRRRFVEITQKVQDTTRDLEAYQRQFGSLDSETDQEPGDDDGSFEEEFEIAAAVSEMAEGFSASLAVPGTKLDNEQGEEEEDKKPGDASKGHGAPGADSGDDAESVESGESDD